MYKNFENISEDIIPFVGVIHLLRQSLSFLIAACNLFVAVATYLDCDVALQLISLFFLVLHMKGSRVINECFPP